MNKLNHVAIIMDGNGRWGLKKKRSRNYGHLQGLKSVETVIKSSVSQKIPFLKDPKATMNIPVLGVDYNKIKDSNKLEEA